MARIGGEPREDEPEKASQAEEGLSLASPEVWYTSLFNI